MEQLWNGCGTAVWWNGGETAAERLWNGCGTVVERLWNGCGTVVSGSRATGNGAVPSANPTSAFGVLLGAS